MNILKFIPAFAALFLFSCSTKTRYNTSQDNLTSSLDQTDQKINVKTNYSKGLNKMKPSKQSETNKYDFLTYANEENFKLLLEENKASFVVFGMVSNDYSDFEKKYGVKVKTENCVISPGISKTATLNNQIVSNYLNEKFNNDWKNDLEILPFGLQK
ncbi:hypothetical protein Q73A0000_15550 [Kaistella flava (ex Peng et al. 2021)]|uniref:Lipoprotein n=1 Tax=Kaistella flava (ex Peng et al. 2021) TaxID=2038776 RepID=A0A7M2YC58_9FLAO|nr:hypothetical protein [Kaistella flava (ex Peng et al. 2021)]QOW11686.1 hypothetical protein Q73A0000_15550 [Kaistella flava (ex Peng et al. 2021)]